MSERIPARRVRIKTFQEFVRDYGWIGDENQPDQSMFVYASDPDAGADVPKDAIVLPWGSDIPPEQARDLSDILGAYARDKGWEWMQIGDAE